MLAERPRNGETPGGPEPAYGRSPRSHDRVTRDALRRPSDKLGMADEGPGMLVTCNRLEEGVTAISTDCA